MFASIYSEFIAKLGKWYLGREYRHIARLWPQYKLVRENNCHHIYFRSKHIATVKNVLEVSNCYRGACFILGSGPSLEALDIGLLNGTDTFTLNGSIKKYEDRSESPTHHVMVDRRRIQDYPEFIMTALERQANCFVPYLAIPLIHSVDPGLLNHPKLTLIESIDYKYDEPLLSRLEFQNKITGNDKIYLSSENRNMLRRVGFSFDGHLGFFGSRSVSVWAIQLALYMGYRTIYLLGMEMGETGQHHFYDAHSVPDRNRISESERQEILREDIIPCFKLIRQATDVLGALIYNLTPFSSIPSDIIPRLTLDAGLKRNHVGMQNPPDCQILGYNPDG